MTPRDLIETKSMKPLTRKTLRGDGYIHPEVEYQIAIGKEHPNREEYFLVIRSTENHWDYIEFPIPPDKHKKYEEALAKLWKRQSRTLWQMFLELIGVRKNLDEN